MGEPIVILALRKKRDRIEASIAAYECKIKEAQADLAHVTASLRLFELSGDPSEFPAYIDLNRILRRGETTKLCLAALADGPMDTRQLTAHVMAAKGLNADDRVLAKAIALRITQTLRVKALRGGPLDGTERRKGVCIWQLSQSRALRLL
jgi:hypothetical protein